MSKSIEPLFTMKEVTEASKNLNLENRGSDKDYNKVIMSEMKELEVTRHRANQYS